MNAQTQDIQWYIARDGKQHGPLTDIEMRTFVAHSYLRPTDLIWRPGMTDWQPATAVFPAVFQPPAPMPVPQIQAPAQPQLQQQAPASAPLQTDFDEQEFEQPRTSAGLLRRLAIAATIITVVGGSAYGIATYREDLARLLPGHKAETPPVVAAPNPVAVPADSAKPADAADANAQPAPADGSPAAPPTADAAQPAQTAAVAPEPEAPAAPPSIAGSKIDARLQKIPAWVLIKKDFPDWYVGHIAAAEKIAADKKPDSEVAQHLAQGLVTLRRQNAEKALAAPTDKLKAIAAAFLDNLKALSTQSVSACYGFISKGETSPAIVEALQSPETANAFNNEINAIFIAVSEGSKNPQKHDAAIKTDFDLLIKELNKLGWKQEDLQVFSDPRLLSKREPAQVCKMVQEWFVAHLAIPDKAAQERLIFETLKPVVSG
jgi:hypothetical protein